MDSWVTKHPGAIIWTMKSDAFSFFTRSHIQKLKIEFSCRKQIPLVVSVRTEEVKFEQTLSHLPMDFLGNPTQGGKSQKCFIYLFYNLLRERSQQMASWIVHRN